VKISMNMCDPRKPVNATASQHTRNSTPKTAAPVAAQRQMPGFPGA
jgi:hypothetical protein